MTTVCTVVSCFVVRMFGSIGTFVWCSSRVRISLDADQHTWRVVYRIERNLKSQYLGTCCSGVGGKFAPTQ